MCGFVAVLGACADTELRRMAEAVAHRGPDDHGQICTGEFAAIHHRLSIIGPDSRGRQPMTRDGVTVVFNGCIYNYRELRVHLEQDGVRFESDADTEVLPHLYRRYGLEMFSRLNGMFSLVLWDTRTRSLVAARDPFGEKPLYLCRQDGRIGFASSLRSFEQGDWRLTPNLHAVSEILQMMAVSAPSTMYREVQHVPAGCYLKCSPDKSMQVRRYFRLPEPEPLQPVSQEGLQASVARQLDQAFLLRAVSDKPLGVFLSGGVDSSLVAESLARQLPFPVHTFSVRFSDATMDYDESAYAARVAAHIGSEHQVIEVRAEAEECLHDLADVFDQPVANSTALPTYLICREAKSYVDVALSGIGGDEFFGGYPRYLGLHWHSRLQNIPGPVRAAMLSGLNIFGESGGSRNLRGRLRRFLHGLDAAPESAYQGWTSFEAKAWQTMFLQSEPERPASDFTNAVMEHGGLKKLFEDYGLVNGAMAYDILRYLPDDLLALGDRMSMAHALELRAPFLDVNLLSLAMSLDVKYKVAGPPWREGLKLLLKDVARERLPEGIVDRPKQGFMAPVKHWLRGPLAGRVEAMLGPAPLCGLVKKEFAASLWQQHQSGRDMSDILWALLLLDIWMHKRGWDFR